VGIAKLTVSGVKYNNSAVFIHLFTS